MFTVNDFITLGLLILLQAVLGFDNLLYIALESKRAPAERQSYVRRVGIIIAIVFRIALLFALVSVIQYFQDPILSPSWHGVLEGSFNIHSLVVLIGGAFIMYTATKEILHMMSIEAHEKQGEKATRSVGNTIFWIVLMNIVFSFDSILSAIALTDNFYVMAAAIVVGGILMIWLSDRVASFLQRHRMYEVLGLFILFIVGIMLVTEGGHLADLHLFGQEITAMSKTTFYFVIGVLVLTDLVQSRYQKKLQEQKRTDSILSNNDGAPPSH